MVKTSAYIDKHRLEDWLISEKSQGTVVGMYIDTIIAKIDTGIFDYSPND